MAKGKEKSVFFCKECGYETAKWMGQCPGCRAWNTISEERISVSVKGNISHVGTSGGVLSTINEISLTSEDKISTGLKELDRVLGGGVVPGSLILVGGDPGIGKSTILLQTCRNLGETESCVLYISGEESLKQIKIRASRIGNFSDNVKILCETNLAQVEAVMRKEKPRVVVIDSIQTMYSEDVGSAPGSVAQVREATAILLQIAKSMEIAVFIVGHVTKEGTVAGPRVLEHMVDTVLYFEGDRHASYRILRGVKNRFGSTNEIGVFEMRESGLAEVENPSEYMLQGRPEGENGCIVACSMEGTRPILVEIQALVCRTNFGFPRRQANGTDLNRLNLLMAVLEKRLGMALGDCDAYVNIAGGMRITEPATDLGIVLAIVSSFRNRPIGETTIAFGEVGLSGEVRAVGQMQTRINEAAKLGFTTCVVPRACKDGVTVGDNMKLIYVSNVGEAIEALLS